jgi:hypothetical protein
LQKKLYFLDFFLIFGRTGMEWPKYFLIFQDELIAGLKRTFFFRNRYRPFIYFVLNSEIATESFVIWPKTGHFDHFHQER